MQLKHLLLLQVKDTPLEQAGAVALKEINRKKVQALN